MSDDQQKQIGIRRGGTSFKTRTGFIKQNENGKIPEVKGPIRKILKPVAILSWSL
jgi:hypothetical protein